MLVLSTGSPGVPVVCDSHTWEGAWGGGGDVYDAPRCSLICDTQTSAPSVARSVMLTQLLIDYFQGL